MNNTLVQSGESESETYLINIQLNTRPTPPPLALDIITVLYMFVPSPIMEVNK